jgi:hypothetical protein
MLRTRSLRLTDPVTDGSPAAAPLPPGRRSEHGASVANGNDPRHAASDAVQPDRRRKRCQPLPWTARLGAHSAHHQEDHDNDEYDPLPAHLSPPDIKAPRFERSTALVRSASTNVKTPTIELCATCVPRGPPQGAAPPRTVPSSPSPFETPDSASQEPDSLSEQTVGEHARGFHGPIQLARRFQAPSRNLAYPWHASRTTRQQASHRCGG